ALLATEPTELELSIIELEDGELSFAMVLREAEHALGIHKDITSYGGWAAHPAAPPPRAPHKRRPPPLTPTPAPPPGVPTGGGRPSEPHPGHLRRGSQGEQPLGCAGPDRPGVSGADCDASGAWCTRAS